MILRCSGLSLEIRRTMEPHRLRLAREIRWDKVNLERLLALREMFQIYTETLVKWNRGVI